MSEWRSDAVPADFLEASRAQAASVLATTNTDDAYEQACLFQTLAVHAMVTALEAHAEADTQTGLNLIWGELTDAMDAPGRGSPAQDAEAVARMRRACTEWLAVLHSPAARAGYLDRWVHEECGYTREPG